MFPQFALSDGKLLDDEVGYGPAMVLLNDTAVNLDSALQAEFIEAGVDVVGNPGPELITWFDNEGAAAVLVSADRAVLGTARTAMDIAELHPSQWKIA